MADPGPVVQTFYVDEKVQQAFRMDAIVTLVDAKHVELYLTEERPEAYQQLAFADIILLNKADLVQRADQQRITARIKEINDVQVIPCEYGKVDLDKIINVGGFDLERVLEREPDLLKDDHKHVCLLSITVDHHWAYQWYI